MRGSPRKRGQSVHGDSAAGSMVSQSVMAAQSSPEGVDEDDSVSCLGHATLPLCSGLNDPSTIYLSSTMRPGLTLSSSSMTCTSD